MSETKAPPIVQVINFVTELLTSDACQVSLTGNQANQLTGAIQYLKGFSAQVEANLLAIEAVEIPEEDVEEMVDENPAD